MSPAPAWTCIDCATRYPTRVTWCSFCSSQGRVVLIGQRPAAGIDLEPESADAATLAALAGDPVAVRAYPPFLAGHGALVVLWGVPSGGKSTMAARWLNLVQGPVLYVSHEEGLGPTIAARLKRLGIKRSDFRLIGRANVDQVVAEIRREQERRAEEVRREEERAAIARLSVETHAINHNAAIKLLKYGLVASIVAGGAACLLTKDDGASKNKKKSKKST